MLNQRGLGVQYVMARDGTIYHTLPEGTRGAHILPSEINDLSNSNTEGMEVIALDDKDVTPQQVQSAKEFAAAFSKTHPGVQYFGHGEVNPSHKQASEGLTIADAVRMGVEPTIITSTRSQVPLEKRTLMNFSSGSVDADRPSSPNFKQPSRPYSGTPDSAVDLTDYKREFDDYSDRKREYNRAIAFRSVTHAASGIDPHQSAGPIVIYDHTGGLKTVITNNVHTAQ